MFEIAKWNIDSKEGKIEGVKKDLQDTSSVYCDATHLLFPLCPPVIPQNFHFFIFHQFLISLFYLQVNCTTTPETFNSLKQMTNNYYCITLAMNGTPGCRQLQCSNLYMGEGTLSTRALACMSTNRSNDPIILSLSTFTTLFIFTHPAKAELLLTSDQSDLLDLLKIQDCENISCVPGPNGPNMQMTYHHCGLTFSCVHSNCMLKDVL